MKNKMTEKLFELAYTDSMTEVPNRNAYEERLKKLRKPNANISRITVIVVDVNGLKEINDNYGHFSGDDAIKTVAKALRDTIGTKADIYRIGGDEFCLVLEGLPGTIARVRLIDIQNAFDHTEEKPYPKGVSFGIIEIPANHDKLTVNDVIHQADYAMYQQKELHKQAYAPFLT